MVIIGNGNLGKFRPCKDRFLLNKSNYPFDNIVKVSVLYLKFWWVKYVFYNWVTGVIIGQGLRRKGGKKQIEPPC